jgi:hypothetical protein
VDRNVQIANCVSQSGAPLPLSRLLAYVLAAGGPPDQLANVRWPLHKALRELLEATGRSGERDLIGVTLTLRPSADGGCAVEGADGAIEALVQCSVLEVQGERREARLVLNEDAAVRLRRELMLLAPEQVAVYRRAGVRWAALASTAAKNRSIAIRSSAATVASSTPNRA